MIETERPGEGGELITFVEFSFDEQCAMARYVMDCLCLRWIDSYPEFQKLLMTILYRGSRGRDMTGEQAIALGRKHERYFEYGLPQFPRVKDGGRIVAPGKLHGKDAVDYLVETKRQIWYDQWDQHPLMRTRLGMWVFPNHEPDERYHEHQYQLEERFWLEVDRRQSEYECSRSEAIRAVSDTHPRAQPEHRLPDPALDD